MRKPPGELIFRYIYRVSGVKKPVDRLWLSENTPTAIQKAFAAMKPAKAYDALAQAAQARAHADWLVGLNATRVFSFRHGKPGQPLSVGRVQTPTLKIIVIAIRRSRSFSPRPIGNCPRCSMRQGGITRGFGKIWQGRWPKSSHPTHRAALIGWRRKRSLLSRHFSFTSTISKKEANRRLGLTAQQTPDAVQSLYDQHLTSYPRTEARVITVEIAKTVASRVQALTAGSA